MINFMVSLFEHEQIFITLGPDLPYFYILEEYKFTFQ